MASDDVAQLATFDPDARMYYGGELTKTSPPRERAVGP
jgi:hypothetical protein